MADITQEINQINTAIYGKDVRNSLANGLTVINDEVTTLLNDQKFFESSIDKQIEDASTGQNTFETAINSKIEASNQDIATMKEIVENSKGTIESAGEMNSKIDSLGKTIIQNELSTNSEIVEVKEGSYKENMILNSNFSGDERRGGGIISNQYGFAETTTGMRVVKGRTYTFTVGGSISEQAIANGGHLMVCLFDTEWSTNGATINITSSSATTQSETFVATKTEYLYVSSFLAPSNVATKCQGSGGKCAVYWYGLVEGSIALNHWTPCSFDLTNGINVFGNSNFGTNGITTNLNGGYWNKSEVELQAGMPYTFTACASIDANTNGSMAICMLFTDDWSQCPSLCFTPTDQPNIMSITFIPQVTQKFKFGLYSRDAQTNAHNVNCNLKWYIVTEGSKPCAWNPSMGDIKGKSGLQLASLGHMTTQMMLAQTNTQNETKSIGKNTAQLMIENSKLKEQIKTLGQMIIKMQLNK